MLKTRRYKFDKTFTSCYNFSKAKAKHYIADKYFHKYMPTRIFCKGKIAKENMEWRKLCERKKPTRARNYV